MIENHPDFELALEPESNIVCFRFVGDETNDIDAVNSQLRKNLIEEGEFYIVQTVLNGETWLRTTIANPFTKVGDFEALLEAIALKGKAQA